MVTKIVVVAMMIDECDIGDEENENDADEGAIDDEENNADAYDDDCARRWRRWWCGEGVIVDRPIQLTQSQML